MLPNGERGFPDWGKISATAAAAIAAAEDVCDRSKDEEVGLLEIPEDEIPLTAEKLFNPFIPPP